MGHRTIPTIGPLFLFQGIAGALLAVLLLLSRRLLIVVMAAGFMIATIGGLLLSINVGLFGLTSRHHTQAYPWWLRSLEPYSLPLSAWYLYAGIVSRTQDIRRLIWKVRSVISPLGAPVDGRAARTRDQSVSGVSSDDVVSSSLGPSSGPG